MTRNGYDRRTHPSRPRVVPRPGAEPLAMARSISDVDWRRAIFVVVIAAVFAFLGTFSVGYVGEAKGYQLLEAIKPTTRFLCFAAISAPATILALMMTALSIGQGWHYGFRPEHFDRIRQIAVLSTLSIAVSVFGLLFLNIPVQESEAFERWYAAIYYSVIILTSIIGGMLIAIVVLLHNAIVALITAVDPHVDASDVLEERASHDTER